MITPDALNIVYESLTRHTFLKVLLGSPGYCILPRESPSEGKTDHAVIMSMVHAIAAQSSYVEVSKTVSDALISATGYYEGIEPVASVLFLETYRTYTQRRTLIINHEHITYRLKQTIAVHYSRLIGDREGSGHLWDDGLYGEIRRISKNNVKYGGLSLID